VGCCLALLLLGVWWVFLLLGFVLLCCSCAQKGLLNLMICDMVFVYGGLEMNSTVGSNVASLKLAGFPVEGSTCGACGESFETPLLAMVFNESVVEEYYACPNCLSKVASIREKTVTDEAKVDEVAADADSVGDVDFGFEAEVAEAKDVDEVAEPVATVEENVAVGGEAVAGCLHEVGYLKKRGKNTPIPEECLTCSKMIDCMY
jgi:hypothetical protein